jgi:non-lysosomal glucosylceramidase
MSSNRRTFLQRVALAAAATQAEAQQAASGRPAEAPLDIAYPRTFTGSHLKMLAFPLGGVGAGAVSLGGRGQLRDWEIFNKPDKGAAPNYAFPSIWAKAGGAKPVARVLEARIQPPYEGASGLGSQNAPGLVRLDSATFTGEFPLARIDFSDRVLPVRVSLEAFTPFIPHEPDDSGLPVAILRYRVANPGRVAAKVSIAWSVDNPCGGNNRENQHRQDGALEGLLMTNPSLAENDALKGSFALCLLDGGSDRITFLRGWEAGRWWNSPMLFWDDFSEDGELGPEPAARNSVGALCLTRTIPAGARRDYSFLLAWHYPNRTPRRCGWSAPKGDEDTLIGNYYTTRFRDAWEAARYAAQNLGRLEKETRRFTAAIRESTVPGAAKEAASANLSTLVSTTCFRTADGEFHGFEGVNDKSGCCFGNCTHVWNYETSTPFLFPSFARSLRASSFGYDLDDAGAIHFRQLLPPGKERSGFAAADGQMGQIMHAYLDWSLSGDTEWLRGLWPRVKKALEFAWVPGGWDADRDGVLEGVQHNTYDVEFYGPNPMCGIYYLGALRAGEEMARAVGDQASAGEYRRLFESGRKWIDANLFNGEYYIQQVRGVPADKIAPSLRSSMGSEGTENPEYQMGGGCLADQLVGQYMAEVAGLGSLVSGEHIAKTLKSIYRYNFKRSLATHENVQRTFALNDEAALVVCDYGKARRPRIPFPYYAEVFTGLEYVAASHMIYSGMTREGVECIHAIRARYDGEKRNPWDEAECGHHYARAMAAWSGLLALSGFRYHAGTEAVTVLPGTSAAEFRCFWSTAAGWGTFTQTASRLTVAVDHGTLACRSCTFRRDGSEKTVRFDPRKVLKAGEQLAV